MDKKLNNIIRAERIRRGLSMQSLADMAGVTKRSIVYWEREGREISIANADKVCKALGISYVIGVGNGE